VEQLPLTKTFVLGLKSLIFLNFVLMLLVETAAFVAVVLSVKNPGGGTCINDAVQKLQLKCTITSTQFLYM
jgi:hypothetical protein